MKHLLVTLSVSWLLCGCRLYTPYLEATLVERFGSRYLIKATGNEATTNRRLRSYLWRRAAQETMAAGHQCFYVNTFTRRPGNRTTVTRKVGDAVVTKVVPAGTVYMEMFPVASCRTKGAHVAADIYRAQAKLQEGVHY